MADGKPDRPTPGGTGASGATEPITLTDPDGAVTRVAPWSSWTREQVRAPGGEPMLVTRLSQGQLWFSAGRRRSPWRHEVHVGPAVVSTPRGRFQATAEHDGGATIACLAGRTRVVAGLREPVLLGPDQSAAVSSDGRTLVVMDRETGDAVPDHEVIDLTDAALEASTAEAEAESRAAAELATVGAATGWSGPGLPGGPDDVAEVGPEPQPDELPPVDAPAGPARLGWIPELVAVAAVLVLLVAAVWVFFRSEGSDQVATATTAAPTVPATSEAPTTEAPTTSTTTSTTEAPTTTTTTARPAAAAVATGQLVGCRRATGGVEAVVDVVHRSGPASRFTVTAALLDAGGQEFARADAVTDVIQPGATAQVPVLVPADAGATGSCELIGVAAR